jgi:alpha-beta hydrolase superfamily lysophospholipase
MTMQLERNLLGARTDAPTKVEVYSGVARLARTVWASEVKPSGTQPSTAIMICHPTANFLGHYALNGLAERGFGAIGFTTRYVGNDSTLIMENCLLDMAVMVDHLYSIGYERVVLIGNSGGASIVPYYQAQALRPTVSSPAGGGPDLTAAQMRPADAIIALNAHPSRSRLSTEWLDPAIHDELHPFDRDPSLDMFHPDNAPPFSAAFIERYRAAQVARNRRIAAWCEQQLEWLRTSPDAPAGLEDIAFTIQGTGADLRFLDGNIDPSDRQIGVTLHGAPQVANYLPAMISRASSCRSFLNQWSIDHTMADSFKWLPGITTPLLIVLGTADPSVLPGMAQQMYDAATASTRRDLHFVKGGTHYFENQPEQLAEALDVIAAWLG